MSQRAGWRMGMPVRRAEARDTTAFLIDHEDGVAGQDPSQIRHQMGELLGIDDIAAEQDDSSGGASAE